MTDDAKKATKYIKNLNFPRLSILLALDILVPLSFSIVFSNFVFLVLFGIPSIIATFVPGGIKYREAEIINFISTIIECVIFVVGIILNLEFISLAIAISFTYAMRIVIYRALKMSLQKAIVRSSIRLLTTFFFFSFFKLGDVKFMGERLVLIISMFTLIIMAFIYLLSKPFEKTIGINPFDIAFAFAYDWIHGTNTIESSLVKESEEGHVIINIINFTDKHGNLKANFIIPYIHPGPFGNVGSANMPKIFHENINRSFTFHGSCTHELNLIKNSDVYAITNDINAEIKKLTSFKNNDEEGYQLESSNYGKFISDGKISILQVDCVDLKKIVFCDGDGDIDVGIGMACSDVFIDMHSSGNDDEIISASAKKGMEIIYKARNLKSKLKEIESKKIQLGIAEGSVRDCDIKAAFFCANEKFALLLFDSNNMQNREILNKLNDKFEFPIFACTTDDHQRDNGRFRVEITKDDVDYVSNLVRKAIDDAKNVNIKFGRIEKEVLVMGKEYEMLQAANFMTVLMKFLLPFLIFITAFFVFVAIVML